MEVIFLKKYKSLHLDKLSFDKISNKNSKKKGGCAQGLVPDIFTKHIWFDSTNCRTWGWIERRKLALKCTLFYMVDNPLLVFLYDIQLGLSRNRKSIGEQLVKLLKISEIVDGSTLLK